jgi:hypothetical protein
VFCSIPTFSFIYPVLEAIVKEGRLRGRVNKDFWRRFEITKDRPGEAHLRSVSALTAMGG